MSDIAIDFEINGETRQAQVPANMLLIDNLRDV